MANVNLREISADTVLSIMEQGTFSHIIIKNVLDKYAYLEKQERSFITRLCTGSVERAIELDYIIDSYSKTKVKKMKPFIRTIMRLGVYEIFYMDSVPDAAAVNEYVKLAKKRGFTGLAGFVNGVLRTISREKEKISIEEEWIQYSIPQWLWDKWKDEYDEETVREIAKGFFTKEDICVRVNTEIVENETLAKALQDQGIKIRWSEDGLAMYLKNVDALNKIPEFLNGEFYVQDYSSMKVVEEAKIKDGDLVLDVCAAPGGKALHAAEKLQGTGKVIARDLTDAKVAIIDENIEKSGLANIKAEVFDATIADPKAKDKYDVVLADLPCSGLGIIRKKPDIKYRINNDSLGSIVELQKKILETVHEYVKAGGTLVYSTCTINMDENEHQVEAFLGRHPDFELVSQEQLLPNDSQDGFFICVMKKILD